MVTAIVDEREVGEEEELVGEGELGHTPMDKGKSLVNSKLMPVQVVDREEVKLEIKELEVDIKEGGQGEDNLLNLSTSTNTRYCHTTFPIIVRKFLLILYNSYQAYPYNNIIVHVDMIIVI